MNLLGVCGIAISDWASGAYPAAVLNFNWMGIAFVLLLRMSFVERDFGQTSEEHRPNG